MPAATASCNPSPAKSALLSSHGRPTGSAVHVRNWNALPLSSCPSLPPPPLPHSCLPPPTPVSPPVRPHLPPLLQCRPALSLLPTTARCPLLPNLPPPPSCIAAATCPPAVPVPALPCCPCRMPAPFLAGTRPPRSHHVDGAGHADLGVDWSGASIAVFQRDDQPFPLGCEDGRSVPVGRH